MATQMSSITSTQIIPALLLVATWLGSSSCDMIPGLGDDSEPVAQEVMRQAEQLETQSEKLGGLALQAQEKAKTLKQEYTLRQKEADVAKVKWETMEEEAKAMKAQAADMKAKANQMKKQSEKLSK